MRGLLVDVFQGMTVIGALGSLAFGAAVVWCTTTAQPMPIEFVTTLVRAMLLTSVGAFALMCLGVRRLSW